MRVLLALIGFALLLAVCWPLALLVLLLWPLIWLIALPFRILGIVLTSVLGLVAAIMLFPMRLLRHP